MTGNDFSLDINNPASPKILCVGNNPDRQNIYSAALGLYNSRIVRLINKKGRLKSSIIIDELPTIYFRGLDNLIATARSNRVAVCLGFQDFSQLERDYGDKEAKVIFNTVGNIFSGQVVGDTARTLSDRFGKIVQLRESQSVSNENITHSTNTQLDALIPPSKISNLTQGMFVGSVADNVDQPLPQKISMPASSWIVRQSRPRSGASFPSRRSPRSSTRRARTEWRRSSARTTTASRRRWFKSSSERSAASRMTPTLRGSCRRKSSNPSCGKPAADGHIRPAQDDWNRRTFSLLYSRHQPFVSLKTVVLCPKRI